MPHDLDGLNPRQREAVTLPVGPALILAGPGSGKTRVLTHRVAYLVQELGVPHWNVLAVTFTNKAAAEMKERVHALLYGASDLGAARAQRYGTPLAVGTFHAICARLLRAEHASIPYERNWIIFDSQDQNQLLADILKETGEESVSAYELKRLISDCKCRGVKPRPLDQPGADRLEPHVNRLYALYQSRLAESNAMDFDDLLANALDLLRTNEAVRDKYRRRWQHVLVDEFQDTNLVQYRLLKQLVHRPDGPQHLFAVGDEDQSIYSFRGANYENLDRFRRDFPRARTILLERNYRSTPQILAVANGLIAHNAARAPKTLFTERRPLQQAVLCEASDGRREAEWISLSAANLADSSRYGFQDMAVMYRTNAQSRELEEAMLYQGIPYRVVGALKFYDRREIKDVLAYLRLIANPRDATSLTRIIGRPARGIGRATVAKLLAASRAWQLSVSDALRLISQGPAAVPHADPRKLEAHPMAVAGRARNALRRFSELLDAWRADLADAETYDAGRFLRHVCLSSGYIPHLEKSPDENQDRLDNLEELITFASHFVPERPEEELALHPLELFLEHVSLAASQDEADDQDDKLTLMTLHTSKGLEYPVVYIAGLDEDLLPHYRSTHEGSAKDIEEERRLLYVGVTRAMDLLFLTRADARYRFAQTVPCEPSRFIDDIPAQALRRDAYPDWHRPVAAPAPRAEPRAASARGRRPRSIHNWEASRTARGAASSPDPSFQPAMTVFHPTFGRGTVIASAFRNGMEEVSVVFDDHGPKRLTADFLALTQD